MSLGQDLAPCLPFLRRYARALTGSQAAGDALVRATLEQIIADPQSFPRDVEPRLALYRTFQAVLNSGLEITSENGSSDKSEVIAGRRLSVIRAEARQALLLTGMEGFSAVDAAYIQGITPHLISKLVGEALSEVERQLHTDVLIVEDEPIIAMDLETKVRAYIPLQHVG